MVIGKVQLIIAKKTKKKILKLSPKIKIALKHKIGIFYQNPYNQILNHHNLKGDRKGYTSINITGDIRLILYKVDPYTYLCVDIDNHNNLYM